MLDNYGIIKGKIKSFETELNMLTEDERRKKGPHYNMILDVNGKDYHVNINIFSNNPQSPDLKIYCPTHPIDDLKNKRPLNKAMKLQSGAYKNIKKNISIDYIRNKMFDLNKLKVFVNEQFVEQLYLYFLLDHNLKIAKEKNLDITVWDQLYENIDEMNNVKLGIHDVHMNQGNKNNRDNGIYNDGLLMISENKEIKFVCFIAFSGQCLCTDKNGNCKNQ
ncbi:DUF2278 family protein [Malacoplasma iowae]|uniref:DUF2278 family protein n=3 Tax=Malacoplasma iowae TaxID=2116 RepID=UPI003872BBDA|nr:DUF2278 family protein [Malacoplasma iowae]